jgi:hypothetical protein
MRGASRPATTHPGLTVSGWRNGNACTTGGLRDILPSAYTERDWLVQVSKLGGPWGLPSLSVSHRPEKPTPVSVEEIKQFPTVDRRRNPGVPSEQREAGEMAVFQELGKALTSSLQLDQILRTIM